MIFCTIFFVTFILILTQSALCCFRKITDRWCSFMSIILFNCSQHSSETREVGVAVWIENHQEIVGVGFRGSQTWHLWYQLTGSFLGDIEDSNSVKFCLNIEMSKLNVECIIRMTLNYPPELQKLLYLKTLWMISSFVFHHL